MQRILVYGTSIFLAGLAEQLHTLPNAQIHQRSTLDNLGDLAAFDVVVVDLNDAHTADVLTLLRARPDLKVIGVNAAAGALTVLAGQVYLAKTVDDILAYVGQNQPP
jgi:hypothetical protein